MGWLKNLGGSGNDKAEDAADRARANGRSAADGVRGSVRSASDTVQGKVRVSKCSCPEMLSCACIAHALYCMCAHGAACTALHCRR